MENYESSSVVAKTSACLRDYGVLVGRLMAAVVNVASDVRNTRETPETVMKQILIKDAELKKVLIELEHHQNYQRKIYQIDEEIVQKEKIIEELAAKLRNAELILEKVVEEARAKKEAMTLANVGATEVTETRLMLQVADLVEYSHKISYTTSAPHNWDSRKPLAVLLCPNSQGYRPPAPQEEHMKASLLYTSVAPGTTSLLYPAKTVEPSVTEQPLMDPRLISFPTNQPTIEEDDLDLELD